MEQISTNYSFHCTFWTGVNQVGATCMLRKGHHLGQIRPWLSEVDRSFKQQNQFNISQSPAMNCWHKESLSSPGFGEGCGDSAEVENVCLTQSHWLKKTRDASTSSSASPSSDNYDNDEVNTSRVSSGSSSWNCLFSSEIRTHTQLLNELTNSVSNTSSNDTRVIAETTSSNYSSISWVSSSEKSLIELSLDVCMFSCSLSAASVAYFCTYSVQINSTNTVDWTNSST